ncbi:hypothetical protein ACN66_16135 [Escherichia coli]|nr:hypothetical protein ACN66_16135 [Escherichia coli]
MAVALPRSVFLTLALHAIVEAGAAWLPLDTGYPDDRLKMMLEDARPSLLITTDDQLPRFSDVPNLTSLCYNAPLTPQGSAPLQLSQPHHTAYIIFTSGSTGRPKGDGRADGYRQPPALDAKSLSAYRRRCRCPKNAVQF